VRALRLLAGRALGRKIGAVLLRKLENCSEKEHLSEGTRRWVGGEERRTISGGSSSRISGSEDGVALGCKEGGAYDWGGV